LLITAPRLRIDRLYPRIDHKWQTRGKFYQMFWRQENIIFALNGAFYKRRRVDTVKLAQICLIAGGGREQIA
jgi:hypothetical protein